VVLGRLGDPVTATDDLRADLHSVQIDVAVLKSELAAHRTQAEARHTEVMAALRERSAEGAVRLTPSSLAAWAKALGQIVAIIAGVAAGSYGAISARQATGGGEAGATEPAVDPAP
jgi:hypothetical protein